MYDIFEEMSQFQFELLLQCISKCNREAIINTAPHLPYLSYKLHILQPTAQYT